MTCVVIRMDDAASPLKSEARRTIHVEPNERDAFIWRELMRFHDVKICGAMVTPFDLVIVDERPKR